MEHISINAQCERKHQNLSSESVCSDSYILWILYSNNTIHQSEARATVSIATLRHEAINKNNNNNSNKSNNNNNTDIYTQRRIEQSYINVLHAGGGH